MSKLRSSLLISLSFPVILLAGCLADKEVVIQPDKEPSEIAKTVSKKESVELTIADVSDLFVEDKTLSEYKDELAEMGYAKPYKDIPLEDTFELSKNGSIYKVEDGFAMIEYDGDTHEVLAITGYQEEQELILQEMKSKAYAKENEQIAEQDEKKKAELQVEIDDMWMEISKLENNN